MNTNIINALRKYTDLTGVMSFNSLLAQAAMKYLDVTTFSSLNDLVRRAANAYTGLNKLSLNDAVLAALKQYTSSTGGSIIDLADKAAIQYNTAPVLNPPVNTVLPSISGTTTEGQTLSTTTGTWTNNPTGYTYQWKRNGSNISGATSSTYLLVTADVGTTITVTVTASNADGSANATSNGVGPVAGLPARTYAEFQTHIQSLATGGVRAWSATNTNVGKYYTTAAAYSGVMGGSSWGPSASEGFAVISATVARVLQHGFANQTIADAQVTNAAQIYFEFAASPISNSLAFPAVTRNGFTSAASSTTGAATRQLVDLIRWDFTLNKAFRSNPFAGTAETEYTW